MDVKKVKITTIFKYLLLSIIIIVIGINNIVIKVFISHLKN